MKKWISLLLLSLGAVAHANPPVIWDSGCTSGIFNLATSACLVEGSASITSVGLSLPTSVFTLSGTPITTGSGTLTGSFNSFSGNQFLGSPANGTSGVLAPRALVALDIPSLSAAIITSGQGTLSSSTSGVTVSTGTNSLLSNAAVDIASASGLTAGLVTTGSQTLAGAKTFSTAPVLSSLTASLPLQLDVSKNVSSSAIDLSGAQATGTLSGSRFPALTGDLTTSAGALGTTLATVNGNVGSFTNTALTVNGKGLITGASSGTTGNLTESTSAVLTISGGTGAVLGSGSSIQVKQAATSQSGYLSSTDWNTFNGKQASGSYITSLTGDVTGSGAGAAATTLATVNSNVGAFTNANITVNAKGLVTAAANGTAATFKAPTFSKFLSTGSTTGYLFTVSSANATVGATYTNNSNTYTVLATISAATQIFTSQASAPTASGTLTKATGTGDATITFSTEVPLATYTTPTSPSPLYLRVSGVGGGGGGGGAGTGAQTAGGTGGITSFGPSLFVANGGLGGAYNAPGPAGGTASISSGASGRSFSGGYGATGGEEVVSNQAYPPGGQGGSSFFSGGGAGGNQNSLGVSAPSNTGAGGGGGGLSSGVGSTFSGNGGAAGGYFEGLITTSVAATYVYSIGAAGTPGNSGTGGQNGGSGSNGSLYIEEDYE